MDVGGLEVHKRIARVRAVADVALLAVVDASEVRIRNVPQRACQVLFPVLNTVLVFVPGILTPCWVGFTRIQHAVEVGVFFAVIKGITVRVVVAWVAGLGRVAVGAVDFNAITDAIAVGVRGGRIGQQCQGLV